MPHGSGGRKSKVGGLCSQSLQRACCLAQGQLPARCVLLWQKWGESPRTAFVGALIPPWSSTLRACLPPRLPTSTCVTLGGRWIWGDTGVHCVVSSLSACLSAPSLDFNEPRFTVTLVRCVSPGAFAHDFHFPFKRILPHSSHEDCLFFRSLAVSRLFFSHLGLNPSQPCIILWKGHPFLPAVQALGQRPGLSMYVGPFLDFPLRPPSVWFIWASCLVLTPSRASGLDLLFFDSTLPFLGPWHFRLNLGWAREAQQKTWDFDWYCSGSICGKLVFCNIKFLNQMNMIYLHLLSISLISLHVFSPCRETLHIVC